MQRAERYLNRFEGGLHLAELLSRWRGHPEALVLALPRGGVPVGYAVADALGLPLDVFVVRKLGVPGHEELAMGAIASGGVRVLNRSIVRDLGITEEQIEETAREEEKELTRREWLYREGRAPEDPRGRIVLLVDDGLATGATMRAAISALRKRHPARIIVAAPVAARDTCEMLAKEADQVVCGYLPERFQAVGWWYSEFPQTTDSEVQEYLEKAAVRDKPKTV